MKKHALLLIDFINDIVHVDGKLAAKGYSDFAKERQTFRAVDTALALFRQRESLIVHVSIAFKANYIDQPSGSPLFGRAADFQVLADGTWGTEFHEGARPDGNEPTLRKTRVCSFFGTSLDSLLRVHGTTDLAICGVSTDLAVESAARAAHDRDYKVHVLHDACAAANAEEHLHSLGVMKKFASVTSVSEVELP